MKCELTPRLSSGDWKEFCDRFHFPATDLPHIQAIYAALLPLTQCCAYYSLDQDIDAIAFSHYAYGFVTLGSGMDELSDLYLNHEQIQEAYIVDCLSLMLLSKAYEDFAQTVEKQTGLYLAELSFLGDTYPLDLLPQMYERLAIPCKDRKLRCVCAPEFFWLYVILSERSAWHHRCVAGAKPRLSWMDRKNSCTLHRHCTAACGLAVSRYPDAGSESPS